MDRRMGLKDVGRRLARRAGYVVHRWPPNRFEAMDAALEMLVRRGYAPRVIIDGGANRGQWFATASRLFPAAAFHVIEPQDACWPDLERAAAARGRTVIHRTAITGPGVSRVLMTRGGDNGNTGAFVFAAAEGHPVDLESPATTLDALLAAEVTPPDRVLLKLDIEGHELEALRGAAALLASVEVIVCEVRFFDINGAGRPQFAEVLAFCAERGFDLYDVDMLSGRRRDLRLRIGDVIFVRRGSVLARDVVSE
jgi:FkbM family methyltransferase